MLLIGCSDKGSVDGALALRSAILAANSCTFQVHITADYGDAVYDFTMDCTADKQGNVTFTVTAPDTIAGIMGSITADGGNLTFDDTLLAIPMLTDEQITPISAPWIFMRTLRGGYIRTCAQGRMMIDDSYEDDALTLDITTNNEGIPVMAEIYWKNRRILTLEVISFVLS